MSDVRPQNSTPHSSGKPPAILSVIGGVAGGVIGGALGYLAFKWLISQNLYSMVVPGALLGLGCGALTGRRSTAVGLLCAVAALVLSVFAEWKTFGKGQEFGAFVTNWDNFKGITAVMIAAGVLFAFWFGMGREGGVWRRRSS
jgi:hypothetical protein